MDLYFMQKSRFGHKQSFDSSFLSGCVSLSLILLLTFGNVPFVFAAAPTVTTLPAQNITKNNATLLGFVSNDGGQTVTATGFQFGLTTGYGQTISGTEEYQFVSKINSLAAGPGGFGLPQDVALDSSGNIFVVDKIKHVVKKFDSSGTYVTEFGGQGAGDGQFSSPTAILIDASDNIYIADFSNDRVEKFNSSLVFQDKTTDITLDGPNGIGIDSLGNIYVSSVGTDSIFKFDSALDVVTTFGSLGTGNTNFNDPAGIYVDGSGNLYIADSSNHRIKKYNSALVFQQSFGSAGSGNGQLDTPMRVTQDTEGNFYVSEFGNNRVQKFDSNFNFLLNVAVSGNGDGFVSSPIGITPSGYEIFIADTGHGYIQKMRKSFSADLSAVIPALTCGTTYHYRAFATNSDGTSYGADESFTTLDCDIPLMRTRGASTITTSSATLAGSHEDIGSVTITERGFEYGATTSYGSSVHESGNLFQGETSGTPFIVLNAVGGDSDNNFYTTDSFDDRIQKFDATGVHVTDFGTSGSGLGEVTTPAVAKGGPDGLIYVVDTGNNRIETFAADGTTPALFATGLLTPTDIAFDASGNVYVLEQGNNDILKFDSSGNLLATLGGGAGLNSPLSLAVDSSGYLYVSDVGNARVVKLDSSGTATGGVISGTGTGDGEFGGNPGYLVVNDDDNLYVADPTNNRVEKFDSNLTFLSAFGSSGTGDGEFSNPYGIGLGADGTMFVADQNNGRVEIFNERFSLPITGLSCGTTYHYRSYGVNPDETGVSGDSTFSTPACAGGGTSGGAGTSYFCPDPHASNYSFRTDVIHAKLETCQYETKAPDELSCSADIYLTKPVKYGAANNPDDVKLLQKYLNTYEGYSLSVDGVYKKVDVDAVKKWQLKYQKEILDPWHITVPTGYVYITSLRKIKQIHQANCALSNPPTDVDKVCYLYQDTLRRGNKNLYVKLAQKALRASQFLTAVPDGVFGPVTELAVKAFQKSHGIAETGVIGPATGTALEKTTCSI
jgi:sugar lactone lactonase YvrE